MKSFLFIVFTGIFILRPALPQETAGFAGELQVRVTEGDPSILPLLEELLAGGERNDIEEYLVRAVASFGRSSSLDLLLDHTARFDSRLTLLAPLARTRDAVPVLLRRFRTGIPPIRAFVLDNLEMYPEYAAEIKKTVIPEISAISDQAVLESFYGFADRSTDPDLVIPVIDSINGETGHYAAFVAGKILRNPSLSSDPARLQAITSAITVFTEKADTPVRRGWADYWLYCIAGHTAVDPALIRASLAGLPFSPWLLHMAAAALYRTGDGDENTIRLCRELVFYYDNVYMQRVAAEILYDLDPEDSYSIFLEGIPDRKTGSLCARMLSRYTITPSMITENLKPEQKLVLSSIIAEGLKTGITAAFQGVPNESR